VLPPYVVPGVNGGEERLLPPGVLDAREQQERLTVGNVSDEKLINIIGQLMATYKKYVEGQIELEPLEHTVKPSSVFPILDLPTGSGGGA
jgi:hypothetical protein